MKRERNRGLIAQTYMLIVAAVIIIGIFTYITQYQIARQTVQNELRTRAADAAGEADAAIRAYPASGWLITRFDAIKQIFECDYLSCLMTDTEEGENPYGYQMFLLSGADPDSVRGTEYEQVYTLGVTADVKEKGTLEAMKEAVDTAPSKEKLSQRAV